jgi:hypothetical protein
MDDGDEAVRDVAERGLEVRGLEREDLRQIGLEGEAHVVGHAAQTGPKSAMTGP